MVSVAGASVLVVYRVGQSVACWSNLLFDLLVNLTNTQARNSGYIYIQSSVCISRGQPLQLQVEEVTDGVPVRSASASESQGIGRASFGSA